MEVTEIKLLNANDIENRQVEVTPSVSDDGLWDLTAHIVGLGKEVYYKVVNYPALIANYKDDCVENFGYAFH